MPRAAHNVRIQKKGGIRRQNDLGALLPSFPSSTRFGLLFLTAQQLCLGREVLPLALYLDIVA